MAIGANRQEAITANSTLHTLVQFAPVKIIPFKGVKNTMFRFSNNEISHNGIVTLATDNKAREPAT